jgi:DNA-binding PadR family transcriptional regulator
MLTTGGITFRLDRMEEQNLIERVRTREDRRVVYAQLTDHGKAVIDEAFGKHLEQQRQLLSGLTSSELDQLALLLKKAEASVVAYDAGAREAVDQTDAVATIPPAPRRTGRLLRPALALGSHLYSRKHST